MKLIRLSTCAVTEKEHNKKEQVRRGRKKNVVVYQLKSKENDIINPVRRSIDIFPVGHTHALGICPPKEEKPFKLRCQSVWIGMHQAELVMTSHNARKIERNPNAKLSDALETLAKNASILIFDRKTRTRILWAIISRTVDSTCFRRHTIMATGCI